MEIRKSSTLKKKISGRVSKFLNTKKVTWRSMYFFGRSISEKYSNFQHFVLMKQYIERLTFMGMIILNKHVTPHLSASSRENVIFQKIDFLRSTWNVFFFFRKLRHSLADWHRFKVRVWARNGHFFYWPPLLLKIVPFFQF